MERAASPPPSARRGRPAVIATALATAGGVGTAAGLATRVLKDGPIADGLGTMAMVTGMGVIGLGAAVLATAHRPGNEAQTHAPESESESDIEMQPLRRSES